MEDDHCNKSKKDHHPVISQEQIIAIRFHSLERLLDREATRQEIPGYEKRMVQRNNKEEFFFVLDRPKHRAEKKQPQREKQVAFNK
ncbi:hypothetical protein PSCICN_30470 [Pseudomonas cichorii]|nr:hypothetical protein PSCICN_30470 [Pseudomonas cichorii]